MKGNRGITLISLVIMIIILLILAGVSIALLFGENGILTQAKEATMETEKAEAEEIVKILRNEYAIDENINKSELEEFLKGKLNKGIIDEYYKNVDETYAVVVGKYEAILDSNGILQGEVYLATGIGTENFKVETKKEGSTTEYELVNDGTLLYGTEVSIDFDVINRGNTGSTIEDLVITPTLPHKTVDEVTEFMITGKVNGIEFTMEKTVSIISKYLKFETQASTWNGSMQTPSLSNMAKISWEESAEQLLKAPESEEEWYSYKDISTEGANTSKWANAKTEDGSYWVWIPRYEYKLDESAQTIDINFIPVSQTTPTNGYKIHPAFEDGSSTNYTNGEWDKELAGIWVMKFESSELNGKMSSQPNITGIGKSVGELYELAYNYSREKDSHMMKNSEWGAIAYLSYSKYGTNEKEIGYNDGNNGKIAKGDYKSNIDLSSTSNIYGIYDLSGGLTEYVSAYIANGHSYISNYGWDGIITQKNVNAYKTLSTKYNTIYPFNTSDTQTNNYNTYANAYIEGEYGYGDAMLEVSIAGNNYNSWNGDMSTYFFNYYPFLLRGGGGAKYYNIETAGIFNFNAENSGYGSSSRGTRVIFPGE